MPYRVAVEDIEPDHYVCWVLDLPGCFSSARNMEAAVSNAPSAIADYYSWVTGSDPSLPKVRGPFEVEVVEVFRARGSSKDPDYVVNAFFEADRCPLSYWDVAAGLRLLDWSRRDLLDVVGALPPKDLHRSIPGEDRGTITGVLRHVAGAENWYFGQLDRSIVWSSLPEDVFGQLEAVRANSRDQLVELAGDGRIEERLDERWSARKVLRRTLWHERDHTQHTAQLVLRLRG